LESTNTLEETAKEEEITQEAQELADELAAEEAQRLADELAAEEEAQRLATLEELGKEQEEAADALTDSLELITPDSFYTNNTSKASYLGTFNENSFDSQTQYYKKIGNNDRLLIPTDTTISMDIDFGKDDDQVTNGKVSVSGYADLEFDGYFKTDNTLKLKAANSTVGGGGDATFFGSEANIISGDIKLQNDEIKLEGEFDAEKYEYGDIDEITNTDYFINNTSTATYTGNFNSTRYDESSQYSSSYFNKSAIDQDTTISMDIDFGATQDHITNGKIDMVSVPDFEFTGHINQNNVSLSGGDLWGSGSAKFYGNEANTMKGNIYFQNLTNSIKGDFEASKTTADQAN